MAVLRLHRIKSNSGSTLVESILALGMIAIVSSMLFLAVSTSLNMIDRANDILNRAATAKALLMNADKSTGEVKSESKRFEFNPNGTEDTTKAKVTVYGYSFDDETKSPFSNSNKALTFLFYYDTTMK